MSDTTFLCLDKAGLAGRCYDIARATELAARATKRAVHTTTHLVRTTARAVCDQCALDKPCDSTQCCALFG